MTSPVYIQSLGSDVRIELYVAPRASRTRLIGEHDGRLKMQVAAPPVDGKANRAILKFFGSILPVAAGSISIDAGATGKRKSVLVSDADLDAIADAVRRELEG